MNVVSNTSPIINLAAIDQLGLLKQLYGAVTIPQAVYNEVCIRGSGLPGAAEVMAGDWIQTRIVANAALVATLTADLDKGEAEAIALAVEIGSDLLLLDERRGRLIASRLGLRCLGLLGLLIQAKRSGAVSAVKPLVDELRARAGFWVSAELYDRVLYEAGE
jgi:predicted nucleic acid-binding protein